MEMATRFCEYPDAIVQARAPWAACGWIGPQGCAGPGDSLTSGLEFNHPCGAVETSLSFDTVSDDFWSNGCPVDWAPLCL